MPSSKLTAVASTIALVLAFGCSDGVPTEPSSDELTNASDLEAQLNSSPPSSVDLRGAMTLRADLDELNSSGADGQVTVVVNNGSAQVTLQARGVSASLFHAQHIHIGGTNTCPTAAAAGSDGLISTVEGAPAYGPVQVSLTTSGDVSAGSALAASRFPVANQNGIVTYERRFDLPAGVDAMDVKDGVIVVHGISELFNSPDAYDGGGPSSLSSALTLEHTIPTLCGKLLSPSS